MSFRVNPVLWPALAVASPVIAPLMLARNRRFGRNRERADQVNRERMAAAEPLKLPELEYLELTVLVEEARLDGFKGDAGVSYLVRTDQGTVLFDVGYGPDRGVLAHNLDKLGLAFDDVEAVVLSHLHLDHMGGMKGMKANEVTFPADKRPPSGCPCFLPDHAAAPGMAAQLVESPRLLPAGLGTTGPLARSLFFLGWTEEQALVARVKDKGTVVITGCGHQTVALLLDLVDRLCDAPLYAFAGGVHLPITRGRSVVAGVDLQTILGTGRPPWKRVTDADLEQARDALNARHPQRVLVSAHDSCDYAIGRLEQEVEADVDVLKAGASYRL